MSHSCHSLQSYLIPTHPFSSSHSKHFNPSNLIHFQVTYHSLCLESSALNHCMVYFQSVRPLLKLTSSERPALYLIPYPRPFTPSSKKKIIHFLSTPFLLLWRVKDTLYEWSHSLSLAKFNSLFLLLWCFSYT